MKKFIIPILSVLIVAASVFALSTITKVDVDKNMPYYADAMPPLLCTSGLEKAEMDAGFAYKTPKSLPDGYSIQDAVGGPGWISMYYAPDSICEKGSKYRTLQDGILQFITANTQYKENEIKLGKKFFEEFKESSDRPERIFLFEIKGNPAMGWESGIKKTITKFENGTLISEEDTAYPAQIQVIDPTNQEFHLIQGYVPLQQLKEMAESIG